MQRMLALEQFSKVTLLVLGLFRAARFVSQHSPPFSEHIRQCLQNPLVITAGAEA